MTDPVMMASMDVIIGTTLFYFRKRAALTLTKMASYVLHSQTSLSRKELGETSLRASEIVFFQTAYQYSLSEWVELFSKCEDALRENGFLVIDEALPSRALTRDQVFKICEEAEVFQ